MAGANRLLEAFRGLLVVEETPVVAETATVINAAQNEVQIVAEAEAIS